MPLHLGRFGYTTDAWAKLIAEPEDRTQAAREITADELVEAPNKAKTVSFRPPGGR
jgi:hypothetical protein